MSSGSGSLTVSQNYAAYLPKHTPAFLAEQGGDPQHGPEIMHIFYVK